MSPRFAPTPAMPGFQQANNIYAYSGANVAKAKAVAGDVSNVPTLRIVHSNSSANINRGQIMRFNLEAMGLKAKTEPIPSAQLFTRAGDKKNGNYDVLAIGWQADYPDPSNFINVLLDGRNIPDQGSSNNAALFNSPKFDKLMDAAAKLSGDAQVVVEPVRVRQRQHIAFHGGAKPLPCPARRLSHNPSFLTGLSLSSLARRT